MTDKAKVQTASSAGGGSGGLLRRLVRGLGIASGVLVLVIAVVVVFAIPIELDGIKGKIEDGAGEALGRPFAIEGPLTLVPSIPPAAQIEEVRIGNPPARLAGRRPCPARARSGPATYPAPAAR